MTDEELKEEIDTDPEGIGYAEHVESGSDTGIAELLNAPRGTRLVPIAKTDLKNLLFERKLLTGLQAATQSETPEVQEAAVYALAFLQDSDLPFLKTQSDVATDMMGSLVMGGVISQEDAAAIITLATVPESRAEQLWGAGTIIHHLDVARALRGGE